MTPDIVTYNTCVTIAGQAGRLDDALELLRKASEEGGLELDVVRVGLMRRVMRDTGNQSHGKTSGFKGGKGCRQSGIIRNKYPVTRISGGGVQESLCCIRYVGEVATYFEVFFFSFRRDGAGSGWTLCGAPNLAPRAGMMVFVQCGMRGEFAPFSVSRSSARFGPNR